jgi:hypothetical protein
MILDTNPGFGETSGNKILDQGCPYLWYNLKSQNCRMEMEMKKIGLRMARA